MKYIRTNKNVGSNIISVKNFRYYSYDEELNELKYIQKFIAPYKGFDNFLNICYIGIKSLANFDFCDFGMNCDDIENIKFVSNLSLDELVKYKFVSSCFKENKLNSGYCLICYSNGTLYFCTDSDYFYFYNENKSNKILNNDMRIRFWDLCDYLKTIDFSGVLGSYANITGLLKKRYSRLKFVDLSKFDFSNLDSTNLIKKDSCERIRFNKNTLFGGKTLKEYLDFCDLTYNIDEIDNLLVDVMF